MFYECNKLFSETEIQYKTSDSTTYKWQIQPCKPTHDYSRTVEL